MYHDQKVVLPGGHPCIGKQPCQLDGIVVLSSSDAAEVYSYHSIQQKACIALCQTSLHYHFHSALHSLRACQAQTQTNAPNPMHSCY